MTEYEQALIAVRDVFVHYPKRYEHCEEELRKVEQEIQDLLHAIELSNFNASTGYQLSKQLQKARKDRRRLKNELELLDSIKEFISYAKPTEKNINKIITDLRTTEQRQLVRVYKMRVRDDLQEMVSK
ncbi:hypothetical protein SAMN05877753_1235 [Bacillus oleivorans]|uniref:Uncharacterized protein n=1 Tax=Bacillus oleivorans TaxID=1448271 RepID=A0A285D809_9BACI|nr:hypothetical protein [Bacillus oleivorans]SNX75949.1 hypothetical protein SAMN05877753_1235 [Bacillus oleivorans]